MHSDDERLIDPTNASSPAYRNLVLLMLVIVYTFNFVDRQILGILAQPIKTDLHLSDTELGVLGGIAFALLYSSLAIPLAVLADKTSRTWMITAALAVWSGFTALCGVVSGFWQFFFFRLGVGVGEAGGVAPSYAIIAEHFPPEKRSRALAIYSLGVPIGLGGGSLLGGYIAQIVAWRTAFLVVGIAGLVLAPVFRLVVREPVRVSIDPAGAGSVDRAPIGAAFAILGKKPSFWLMSFAAAFSSLCGYGLAFWVPSVLIRSFGFELITASRYVGSLLFIGGIAGVFGGGWLADRLGPADRSWYARLPAIAWLITAPLFAAALFSASPTLSWFLFVIPYGLNILWLAPVTNAVQHLVPRHMRATAAASFLFIVNLIGVGLGSWLMGTMSDAMTARYGVEALRFATIFALGFYLLAALIMFFAVRPLRRDWYVG